MSLTPFRPVLYASLAASFALPAVALAGTSGSYLTWSNKTPAHNPVQSETPPATVESSGETYAVPPSPYGQIGDPFRRSLSWPSKQAPNPPETRPEPRPEPRQEVASVQPLPPPAPPRPQIPVPAPPVPLEPARPSASVTTPLPLPAPRPVTVPEDMVADDTVTEPQASAPQPAARQPEPRPEPAPAPVQAAAPPVPPPATGEYQVPATSKYAAQINAARAEQARRDAQAKAAEVAAAAKPPAEKPAKSGGKPAAKPAEATAPEPSSQMAEMETDHVFIPGETYKSAGDAPRLYSLHRAYGLQPDPITVTPNATGAILEAADLNADEGPPKPAATATDTSAPKANP